MVTRGNSSCSYLEALVEALTHVSPGLSCLRRGCDVSFKVVPIGASPNQPFRPSRPKAKHVSWLLARGE